MTPCGHWCCGACEERLATLPGCAATAAQLRLCPACKALVIDCSVDAVASVGGVGGKGKGKGGGSTAERACDEVLQVPSWVWVRHGDTGGYGSGNPAGGGGHNAARVRGVWPGFRDWRALHALVGEVVKQEVAQVMRDQANGHHEDLGG